MPPKKKSRTSNVKRLAKGLSKNPARSRVRRTRKNPVRSMSGGNAGGTLADERNISALTRLMGALQTEKIRFQLIGMSAAIIQGVPGSTIDVDLWIDLPARQYMRVLNIAKAEGAEIVRNTVVELSDKTLVNFVYEVTGLGSFASEFRKAKKLSFHGLKVAALSLASIRKSKLAVARPKDLTHVQQIEDTLKFKKAKEAK
jgi:hypothetical protein